MLEFILAVSLEWEQPKTIYIGTFENCAVANAYYEEHLAEEFKGSTCLHQDYVFLPKDFEHKYIK